jgi:hypothetical protein
LCDDFKPGEQGVSRLTASSSQTWLTLAEHEALKADLEVDEGPEARLATFKNHYEVRKGILKFAEDRFKAGQDNQLGVLQAEAFMLEAQIELLREELKAKQSK